MTTDRVYQGDDNQWYFNIRGNQPLGPFETYHLAEKALHDHVSRHSARVSSRIRWPRVLKPTRILRRSAPRHT